jgi:hypothetical protein
VASTKSIHRKEADMKRTLSAIAVALAASLSAQASAQTFPDGYTVLSAEDLAPRAGAN